MADTLWRHMVFPPKVRYNTCRHVTKKSRLSRFSHVRLKWLNELFHIGLGRRSSTCIEKSNNKGKWNFQNWGSKNDEDKKKSQWAFRILISVQILTARRGSFTLSHSPLDTEPSQSAQAVPVTDRTHKRTRTPHTHFNLSFDFFLRVTIVFVFLMYSPFF